MNEIPLYAWSAVIHTENLPNAALEEYIDLPKWNLTKRQVPYVVGHRMLLAHAKAYRLYREEFFARQKGGPNLELYQKSRRRSRVGLVSGGRWVEPQGKGHEEAARRAFAWHFRWINDPIYGDGDYPEEMRSVFFEIEKNEGRQILPRISDEERKLLKGSADFIGINYYKVMVAGNFISDGSQPHSQMENDGHYDFYPDRYETISGDTWLRNTPFGLEKVLHYVRDHYGNIATLISENGCADVMPLKTGRDPLDDPHRIRYIRDHVEALGNALSAGCNVFGYTAWSLIDNFEWDDGFAYKFGLYHVDFDSPDRTRRPKRSALFYKKLIAQAKSEKKKKEEI